MGCCCRQRVNPSRIYNRGFLNLICELSFLHIVFLSYVVVLLQFRVNIRKLKPQIKNFRKRKLKIHFKVRQNPNYGA